MHEFPEQTQSDPPPSASVLPNAVPLSGQTGSQQRTHTSRRTWGIITAGGLLLVLITGALGFFVILPSIQQSSLERTLQTYCDAYKTLNDKELESTFSARFKALPVKKNRSEGDYLFAYLQIKGFGASLTNCTVSSIQQHNTTATATITLLLHGGATLQGNQNPALSSLSTQKVSLILEHSLTNWKVNDTQDG